MKTEAQTAARTGAGVIVGLGIMAVGLIMLLANLGIVDGTTWLRYWPVVVMLVGLHKLLQPRPGARLEGSIWIVVGTALLLGRLGILHFGIRDLWPLLIIVVGAHLFWRGLNPRRAQTAALHSDAGAHVSAVAVMGGVARSSNAPAFQGGSLTAIMGGCEIDLTQARVAPTGAVIEVFAFWGGIVIRVPPDWSVTSEVVPIMGGYDDRTVPSADAGQRLVISGLVLMGGVEVKVGPRRSTAERMAAQTTAPER